MQQAEMKFDCDAYLVCARCGRRFPVAMHRLWCSPCLVEFATNNIRKRRNARDDAHELGT